MLRSWIRPTRLPRPVNPLLAFPLDTRQTVPAPLPSRTTPSTWPLSLSSATLSPTGRRLNATMAAASGSDRGYAAAVDALNSLQSNAATLEAIRKSGGKLNDYAIPEMIEYLFRIGYSQSDLNRLNVVHVTGTKGKGSTSAFCDSLFRQLDANRPDGRPIKVGLFTSPHMCAVRERIRINGIPIPEETFAKYFWQVWDKLAENPQRQFEVTPLRPVYFRFLTLLSYHIFLQEDVDATILEVGIGGKFDSTNIVPKPLVTAITQLGLDHTAILGNTVEEIAVQKGGIFKSGAPALSWARQPGRAIEELQRVADEAGTKLETIDLHPAIASDSVQLGLPGVHQNSNASLALAIMDRFLASEAGKRIFSAPATTSASPRERLASWQRQGLEQARWPGRCQTVPSKQNPEITWYLDGAHTTDSLSVCLGWFVGGQLQLSTTSQQKKRTFIFNCTHGRSAAELLQAVLERIETDLEKVGVTPRNGEQQARFVRARTFFDTVIFCTNITFSSGGWASDLTSKAIDPNDLSALTVQRDLEAAWSQLLGSEGASAQVLIKASIQDAIAHVREQAAHESIEAAQSVLVTGSLHLVGGVMAHLKQEGSLDDSLVSTVSP
ncbi:Folylpolyglutamate synthetase [Thecaphora frezii]